MEMHELKFTLKFGLSAFITVILSMFFQGPQRKFVNLYNKQQAHLSIETILFLINDNELFLLLKYNIY